MPVHPSNPDLLDEREPERRWHGVARPQLAAGAAAGSVVAAAGLLAVPASGLPAGYEPLARVAFAVPFLVYVVWWLGSPGLAREKRRAALDAGPHSWHFERADAEQRVQLVAAAFDRAADGGIVAGGATLDRLDLPAFARTLRRGVPDLALRERLRASVRRPRRAATRAAAHRVRRSASGT